MSVREPSTLWGWGIASGIFLFFFFFFFNYTPRDVQKNYHQRFSGYECTVYRIYESKLSLRIELLSYIFPYPRRDENRSILLIYLSKHLMTVWMIKQQETILFVTGKKMLNLSSRWIIWKSMSTPSSMNCTDVCFAIFNVISNNDSRREESKGEGKSKVRVCGRDGWSVAVSAACGSASYWKSWRAHRESAMESSN